MILIKYLIYVDIILSWVTLFIGKTIRPGILADIIDPLYKFVQKYIPTKIGMFDLTPIVILFIIIIATSMIYGIDQDVYSEIQKIYNYL